MSQGLKSILEPQWRARRPDDGDFGGSTELLARFCNRTLEIDHGQLLEPVPVTPRAAIAWGMIPPPTALDA